MTPTQKNELKRSATEEPETRALGKRLAKSPQDVQDGDVGPSWNRLSSSVPPEDSLIEHGGEKILDLDNEDEDDIPYTHRSTSRSQSPLFLGSDTIDGEPSPTSGNGKSNNTLRGQNVISLDDEDDDIKEYYVISDSEEEEEEGEVDEQIGEDGKDQVKHKTTTEQLQENQKSVDSKISDAHCAVCFDSPEQTYVLPCGHLYCGDCVFKALSSTKQSTRTGGPCSLCRAYTPYKKIILAVFKKKRKALI